MRAKLTTKSSLFPYVYNDLSVSGVRMTEKNKKGWLCRGEKKKGATAEKMGVIKCIYYKNGYSLLLIYIYFIYLILLILLIEKPSL